MTLYTPLLMEAVTGDPAITYHGQDYRQIISTLTPFTGVVHAGDLKVTQRAAGANLSVDVAAGRVLIPGTAIANQGTYICFSDTVVNVPLAAPSTSNPRIDIIVATIHDKQADGGSSYGWTLAPPVTGTPAASPTAPATPASSVKLAEVYVPQNATSILNTGTNAAGGTGSITDKRILSGTGDVPKFDCNGTPGTPQSIPTGSEQFYVPATTSQLVGMTAGANPAEVIATTPGRYAVHFCIRLQTTGSACRRIPAIVLTDTDGTTLLRRIANSVDTTNNAPVSASGTLAVTTGQHLSARIYQDSGSNLSVDNSHLEANFTVVWIGA